MTAALAPTWRSNYIPADPSPWTRLDLFDQAMVNLDRIAAEPEVA